MFLGEMKSRGCPIESVGARRKNSGSTFSSTSSASSHMGSKLCGCGQKLLLLKVSTVKNNERMFC